MTMSRNLSQPQNDELRAYILDFFTGSAKTYKALTSNDVIKPYLVAAGDKILPQRC